MAGQSVEDMERVIAAMRRVVERLQTENDNLKKYPASGQTQLNELTEENTKLKVSLIVVLQGDLKPRKFHSYKRKAFCSMLNIAMHGSFV